MSRFERLENADSQERKEMPPVELSVRPPDGDKNFMVQFTSGSKAACTAFNAAVAEVLKREGLQPFHQIGTKPSGPNEPGYHGWEVWVSPAPGLAARLESLLPEIRSIAEKNYPMWADMYPEQKDL